MTFSSTIFVFGFLPIFLIINIFLKNKYRNLWLFMASILFYAWAQPKYLCLLVVNVFVNYFFSLLCQVSKYKKCFFCLGIAANISVLAYFKYANFVISTFNVIASSKFSLLEVALPIGISFYTFKGISYLVDCYRGDIRAQRNPLNVAVYLCMFPQIMSGPIERYESIQDEIVKRDINLVDFCEGIERFILGLSKKVIVANALGEIVDMIWSQGAGSNTISVAWLGSIAYTLQIYFDFSGYSDMAIGIGRMIGFHFAENFNFPYLSRSVTEFWRRWHITLGSWFRDYVYIPLGGNRKRIYLNLSIVFFLTGLWHGAAWNFVLWGIFHGIFMLAERYLKQDKPIVPLFGFIDKFISHLYLLLVVNLGWILFRANNVTDAIDYLKTLIGINVGAISGISLSWYLNRWNVFILVIAIIFSTELPINLIERTERKINKRYYIILKYIGYLMLLLISLIRVVNSTYSSFIYFQF